jgi:serine/threonine protein kinase
MAVPKPQVAAKDVEVGLTEESKVAPHNDDEHAIVPDVSFFPGLTHLIEVDYPSERSRKQYFVCTDSQRDIMGRTPLLVVDYGRVLGGGSQGTVYQGCFGRDKIVAVKVFQLIGPEDATQLKVAMKEFDIVRRCSHDSIVECYMCGVCTVARKCLIVLEYCEYGDLWQYIQHLREEGRPLSLLKKLEIIFDVASAVAWLHCMQHPVLHGDLKASNVLIDKHGRAKVSDFGISTILEGTRSSATIDDRYTSCS